MAENELAPPQDASISPFVAGFNNLALFRQVGLLVGLAASIAIGFGVVLWTKESNFRPLYSDLTNLDAVEISDILQQNNIGFKFDSNSGLLLVDAAQIHQARLSLASSGYTPSIGGGHDMLNQDASFGTSQFIENARYHRSIEMELSKTISSIANVRSARVHLAIPKRSVFVGDKRKPSASVLVELFSGRSMDPSQVSAVVHLVAASVPELSDKSVTVVDQQGNLLSNDATTEEFAQAGKQYDYTRRLEQHYIDRINNILTPMLGSDGFKVQVSANVDFTSIEQASEQFNPDMSALRSERILDEERGSAGVGGVPGALSNQPPADASVPQVAGGVEGEAGGSTSNRRSQATKNYELDRTVSHTRTQYGRLQRLTVAVVVDKPMLAPVTPPASAALVANKPESASEEGETKSEVALPAAVDLPVVESPFTPEKVAKVTALIENSIGFDAARGDSVKVIMQTFYRAPDQVPVKLEDAKIWEQAWFLDLAKQGIALLAVLALIFGVLRPILKNISTAGKESIEMSGMEDFTGETGNLDSLNMEENVTLSAGSEALLGGPDDKHEQQLGAVKSMVSEDPRRVAQVVKKWLTEDG